MKKIILFIQISLFVVLFVAGCSKSNIFTEDKFSSPRKSFDTYINALKNGNYELAYECYSEEYNKKTKNTFESFKKYFNTDKDSVNHWINNVEILEERGAGEDVTIITDMDVEITFSKINNQWKITDFD